MYLTSCLWTSKQASNLINCVAMLVASLLHITLAWATHPGRQPGRAYKGRLASKRAKKEAARRRVGKQGA